MRVVLFAAALLCAAPAIAGQDHRDGADGTAAQMQHRDHCGLPAGEGLLAAVDVAKSRVTISHEAIELLGWGEATTDIAAAKAVDLAAFAAGDRVHFLMASDKKGKPPVIIALCAADADAAAHEACMAAMHRAAMKAAAARGQACGAGADAHQGHGDMMKPDDHSGHH